MTTNELIFYRLPLQQKEMDIETMRTAYRNALAKRKHSDGTVWISGKEESLINGMFPELLGEFKYGVFE